MLILTGCTSNATPFLSSNQTPSQWYLHSPFTTRYPRNLRPQRVVARVGFAMAVESGAPGHSPGNRQNAAHVATCHRNFCQWAGLPRRRQHRRSRNVRCKCRSKGPSHSMRLLKQSRRQLYSESVGVGLPYLLKLEHSGASLHPERMSATASPRSSRMP